jgi:hypothetical protein
VKFFSATQLKTTFVNTIRITSDNFKHGGREMGKNYNETVVLGRLKNDPIRVFHDDRTKDYVKFFICRENNDGTVDEHEIMSFGRLADTCETYIHRNDLCCIEGTIDTEISSRPIIAKKIIFPSKKN